MFGSAAIADFSSQMSGFYPPHGARWPGAGGDPFAAAMDMKSQWSDSYAAAHAGLPFTAATPIAPYEAYPTTSMAAATTAPYKMDPAQYYGMMNYAAATDCWKKSASASTTASNSTHSSASPFSAAHLMRAVKHETPQNLPYRTGPGTNNVRVRTQDKYRMVYSDYIRLELEKEFHMQEFITAERKADLASKLNLTERQIKIWFQNRRAKQRRDQKSKQSLVPHLRMQ